MTREEIIKEVSRRKAGEKPVSVDKAAELIVQDLLIGRHCRGTLALGVRQKVNALLAEEKLEEAMKVDAQGRSACGYDFNKTIMAGAFDGKVHAYKCPNCGLEGEYKAPRNLN